jgi:hypothetical protein
MHITAVDEHPYPTEEPRGSVGLSVRLFTRTQPAVSTDHGNEFSEEILTTLTIVSLLRTGPRNCGSFPEGVRYSVLTGSGGHPIMKNIF